MIEARTLPHLRKKIRRSFLVLIALYAALGVFMVASVFLAGGMSPKIIHVNYDSIAAGSKMRNAWNEISLKPSMKWVKRFQDSLHFAEGNITEPGEQAVLQGINKQWDKAMAANFAIPKDDIDKMKRLLGKLVHINEKGMFSIAKKSRVFSQKVFAISLVFFLATLALAFLFADSLASRLSQPITQIADTLHGHSGFEPQLKLPLPDSIEIHILVQELAGVWERLGRFQRTNIEQIAFQHEQLRAILASVEDALLVLDHDGRVLHVSEGMARILETAPEALVGRQWAVHTANSGHLHKLRANLMPETPQNVPIELLVSGVKRVYIIRSREIVSAQTKRIGFLYLLHDVTEMHHKERLKNEFIGVLSHELKTPLQSLGTASELLVHRKAQFDDEVSMLVETIAEDISRIRAVASDFVQVGITDLRSLKLRLDKMPLNQLVADWIKPFRVLARDKNVGLEFLTEGSQTIWANVDVVKLPWAITNLLANAIRVSEPGSKVSVFLTDRSDMAQIEIKDEGPGISEEVQKHMFEPYFQAYTGTNQAMGFLGLGLTIAKEVVEAHGGRIEFFPRQPRGSAFRVSIPYLVVYS